ncbi:MAG: hypothetical protein IPK53_01915 [bacterium]|nr:hypothetical protein [bacterium]
MKLLAFLVSAISIVLGCDVNNVTEDGSHLDPYDSSGLRIADYLLSQQNAAGAIPDAPGVGSVNTDSNMEYALMGLAAAYDKTGDARYLTGLESGIRWLAAREEMADTNWRGSWAYAYSASAPYAPLMTSPGDPEILDVRGVDATSALFVHLLYLHRDVSNTPALAQEFEPHARAALSFLRDHNRSADGFYYSSWQLHASDSTWQLWPFRYSADQGDVYLGYSAGYQLYGDAEYLSAVQTIATALDPAFYNSSSERFAVGIYDDLSQENPSEGFAIIFPQGYLAWVFGTTTATVAAREWLAGCIQSDGSLSCYAGDPRFSMSVAVYALACAATNAPRPTASLDWLIANTFDDADGGVRDDFGVASPKFPNVAGFTAMAMLNYMASPPIP